VTSPDITSFLVARHHRPSTLPALVPLDIIRVATATRGNVLMDALLSEKAEAIRQIARAHGATRMRVFGSRAQDTASQASDLDLLVDFEDGRDLLDVVALKQDLEALLGCKVDVVEEAALSPYLKDRIVEQAVPL